MKTKIGKFCIVLSMPGLLASCTHISSYEAIQDPVIRTAVENAATRSDHYALAKHFEDAAKEMQAKAEEKKALLEAVREDASVWLAIPQFGIAHLGFDTQI